MKRFFVLISALLLSASLFACGGEKTFEATVIQHISDTVLVAPEEDSDEYAIADRIYLSPENIDVMQFAVGDRIKVSYSGDVAESYPAMITDISSIETVVRNDVFEEKMLVLIDGVMYVSTGAESTAEARCGTFDGTVSSTVDPALRPTENGQSNFGEGYGYQLVSEDTAEVCIDGKWMVFKAE